jgi:hypothetical protein
VLRGISGEYHDIGLCPIDISYTTLQRICPLRCGGVIGIATEEMGIADLGDVQ